MLLVFHHIILCLSHGIGFLQDKLLSTSKQIMNLRANVPKLFDAKLPCLI